MLAFAPMPCVPASLHDMAKMRVGTGQPGGLRVREAKKGDQLKIEEYVYTRFLLLCSMMFDRI